MFWNHSFGFKFPESFPHQAELCPINRCVPDSQRSFGLGIQWILMRTLGRPLDCLSLRPSQNRSWRKFFLFQAAFQDQSPLDPWLIFPACCGRISVAIKDPATSIRTQPWVATHWSLESFIRWYFFLLTSLLLLPSWKRSFCFTFTPHRPHCGSMKAYYILFYSV